MKKINIRFVKVGEVLPEYQIQKKTFFGWRDIGYWQGGGAGDSAWNVFKNKDCNVLLKEVLDKYYSVSKRHVTIIEHPTIKIY